MIIVRTISCAIASLLLSAGAQAEPAASAPQTAATALDPLSAGTSRFTFSNWAGPELLVHTYVPEGLDLANAPSSL